MGLAEELRELEELRKEGLLTEEEFAAQKQRLLTKPSAPRGVRVERTAAPPRNHPQAQAAQRPPMPPTHLGDAVLVTLFCCLPAGIVAIVKGAGVSGAYASGDYERAQRLSREAGTWTWVSAGLGLLFGLIYILLDLAGDY